MTENMNREPGFFLNLTDRDHTDTDGMHFKTSCSTFTKAVKRQRIIREGSTETVITDCGAFRVEEKLTDYDGCCCVRHINTIVNTGSETLPVDRFSSGLISIPVSEDDWFSDEAYCVWTCMSGWAQEAQWKHCALHDLGLVPVRQADSGTLAHYLWRSEGSWSTTRYYPLVVIEDLRNRRCFFIEHEGGLTWEISLNCWEGTLTLECNGADLHHDGWHLELAPGDSWTATPCVTGSIEGGFEEAVAQLTAYKRAVNLRPWGEHIPVCYNVFMGGIWGEPTDTDLLPLIDACAADGVEIFCIDAGWYRVPFNKEQYSTMGDYVPYEPRFGQNGFKGVIDHIREKGMIPGVWFEFEAANAGMWAGERDGRMLTRNGHVITPDRGFYDLCDREVREHLMDAINHVYQLGVRYIKNDYNFATGIGIGEKNMNAEARRRAEALERFVDEIYLRYPDMIIENCGSGAQREDNGTLRHFHLQSTSDQEMYYHYPWIAAGTLALMPPEKAANWAYPYATTCNENDRILTGGLDPSFLIENNLDGEVTTFNMVTGFMGVLYLSGRLDLTDETNTALIREGIALYKEKREFIRKAHGIFPKGFGYNGKRGFYAAGMMDEKNLLLYVWKIRTDEQDTEINLRKYLTDQSEIRLIYPAADKTCNWSCTDGLLKIHLPGSACMARLYEVIL